MVIPDGPYEGRRFRVHRQPYTGLWLDAIDSGLFTRFAAVGPTQSGKTLSAYILPALYHLFEVGETVICGLPTMDIAKDKWNEDLLPAIEASKYRDLLPRRGGGSRGGTAETIRFPHGATLKFMSGGGSDKKRAAFTARVVLITEVDGLDETGESSREADKVTQIEARSRAYGSRRRTYLECTVSVEEGRIWREYRGGTEARIHIPCPDCEQYVNLEREHLHGWKDCDTLVEAKETATFRCPACEAPWSEGDWRRSNARALLVHRGQEIVGGRVVGDMPRTDTLGFRWSAANNLFVAPGDIGADEWRGANALDNDNAERELCQFVWAVPPEPTDEDLSNVDAKAITERTGNVPRGFIPASCTKVTVGIDLGKWLCHWMAFAWQEDGTPWVIDYGALDVYSRQFGVEAAIMNALVQFREDTLEAGWAAEGGVLVQPSRVFVDAAWMTDVAYDFIRSSDEDRYWPMHGYGAGKQHRALYRRPSSKTSLVRTIGEEYHVSRLRAPHRIDLVHVNADHWKSWLHARITTPLTQPGALRLFRGTDRGEHYDLARHWTAERRVETFVPGKGTKVVWERLRKQNHWFDAGYNACAAAHHAGIRLGDQVQDDEQQGDGSWFASQRRGGRRER